MKSILNSLANTLNGGVPAIANNPSKNANPDNGKIFNNPFTLDISLVLYFCKMFPEDRNNMDFVKE